VLKEVSRKTPTTEEKKVKEIDKREGGKIDTRVLRNLPGGTKRGAVNDRKYCETERGRRGWEPASAGTGEGGKSSNSQKEEEGEGQRGRQK